MDPQRAGAGHRAVSLHRGCVLVPIYCGTWPGPNTGSTGPLFLLGLGWVEVELEGAWQGVEGNPDIEVDRKLLVSLW